MRRREREREQTQSVYADGRERERGREHQITIKRYRLEKYTLKKAEITHAIG